MADADLKPRTRAESSARRAKMRKPLTEETLRKTMLSLFPKRNDYGSLHFDELSQELQRFGISSRGDFSKLMKHHRRQLIQIDRQRLAPHEVRFFSAEFGEAFVKDAIRRQYWFAFPALVRSALELQFGEQAIVRA